MEVFEELQKIFKEVFDDPDMEINMELSANDVNDWTSLTHMQLLATIEEKYSIKFNTRDIRLMKNVGDLVSAIQRKIG